MVMRKKIFASFLFFSLLLSSDHDYKISLGSFSSNSDQWWQKNNSYGASLEGNLLNFSYKKNTDKLSFGINSLFSDSKKRVFFKEVYFNYTVKNGLIVKSGRFNRQFSKYLNDSITSGSILLSNNAQALPKIGLFWTDTLRKNSKIVFDIGIAHGIFDKNEFYSKAPYLHEKFIYLNYISHDYELGLGLVHEAVWGGTTLKGKHIGRQPSSFKDFLKVFISADGPLKEGEVHANALGNHLGIWDFYYKKNFENLNLKLYYQHFFEDTSSFRFANKTDGLWGIEIISAKFNILFEYINTTNACIDPPYQCDNYYWNYQYASGWRYKGNIIGHPLINTENSTFIDKIKAMHIGTSFNYKSYNFNILALRNTNRTDQTKALYQVSKKLTDQIYVDFLIFKDSNTSKGININYLF